MHDPKNPGVGAPSGSVAITSIEQSRRLMEIILFNTFAISGWFGNILIYTFISTGFSMKFLSVCMNLPASAPSMAR